MEHKKSSRRKIIAALVCGMLGCVFMCSGDWMMMYGDTAYHGETYWLTEGVAQIPSWRNLLSMLVAFPAVILYGIGLFTIAAFIKQEKQRKIYRNLTAFGMMPWLCIHLYVVMVLYIFGFLSSSGNEAALMAAEAAREQFVWVVILGEIMMALPFIYWFYLQLSEKTVFPRGLSFTNVLIIYGVLRLVNSLIPDSPFKIGFANGMMSESMFIWFGIMLGWSVFHLKEEI